jgi:hypothetical protein
MPSARRFPPPWIVDEHTESFIVRDKNGQALGYFYFEDEPGRRSAAKLLTKTRRGGWLQTSPSCRSCGRTCPARWTGARGGLFKMPLTIGRYGHNRDSGDGCGLGCSHTDPGPGRRTGSIGGWGSFSLNRSSIVSVLDRFFHRSQTGYLDQSVSQQFCYRGVLLEC